MDTPHTDRRDDASVLHVIANKIENLHEDVGDMKLALKDLASAIIKLALVEERQGQSAIQMERAFTIMERLEAKDVLLEARIVVLEVAAPMSKQTNAWVLSGVWAAVSVVALIVLKAVGAL